MRERLYRSRSDRMLFGVAGGMADWLDLDPSVVRLVWALLIVAGGVGLLLYIIAAIVIPEEPLELGTAAPLTGPEGAEGTAAAGSAGPQARWESREARRAARRARHDGGTGAIVFGLILVIAGAWFLVQRFVPALDTGLLWPALLIIVGGILVVTAMGRPRNP